MSKQMPSSSPTAGKAANAAAATRKSRSNIVDNKTQNVKNKDEMRGGRYWCRQPQTSSSSSIPYFRDKEREQERLRRLYGYDAKNAAHRTDKEHVKSQDRRSNDDSTDNRHNRHEDIIQERNQGHCCRCNGHVPPQIVYVSVPHYHWPLIHAPTQPMPIRMPFPARINSFYPPQFLGRNFRPRRPNMSNRKHPHPM